MIGSGRMPKRTLKKHLVPELEYKNGIRGDEQVIVNVVESGAGLPPRYPRSRKNIVKWRLAEPK